MGEQDKWADQQYIANEAVNALDELISGLDQLEQIGLHAFVATHSSILHASLTLVREVILQEYGLNRENLLASDIDDFVEFIVDEVNK
jgi:hypothetical protein